jgi:hypothetical protein
MTRSKGLLTLFAALAAFGCVAVVETGQASRHESGRQGGASLEKCVAMIGTLPAWQLMKTGRPRSDANLPDLLEIGPFCAGMG